jgi:hypothetical protein
VEGWEGSLAGLLPSIMVNMKRHRFLLVGLLAAASTTSSAQLRPSTCCIQSVMTNGLRIADRYRVEAISARRFTHAEYWRAIEPALRSSAFKTAQVGVSILGRPIRTVTFGTGPTRVLLWSQMHGDESTASMALADIFRFLAEAPDDSLRRRLASQLTITFIPMLNPDGAELFQRENALGIDVNRDARRLSTPEGRALKQVHEAFRPEFGFNLHDQNARTRVGRRGLQSGIALLAPAFDSTLSYNNVRGTARLVAASLATLFEYEIPGRVAKYDDAFNPRAFGDLMQQWGTSTVLIESGALPEDPQKQKLRALNVAGILGALDAVATRSYSAIPASKYEDLPFNQGGAFDVLVLGGQLVLPDKPPMVVDLAINFDDAVARQRGRVRDSGDLSDAIAIDTINAAGLFLHPSQQALTSTLAGPMLRLGNVAEFDIRRGATPSSELVRRFVFEPPRPE